LRRRENFYQRIIERHSAFEDFTFIASHDGQSLWRARVHVSDNRVDNIEQRRQALGWVEGNMGELPAIYRWTENAVEKAGSVALVLMPGSNIVCLLLGHKRMDPRRFVPLLCIGIAIKLAVLWRGGQIFAEEIKSFLNWIEKYQWYVVMALFALSMLQSVRKGRPQGK
jgi:hypothetical protein